MEKGIFSVDRAPNPWHIDLNYTEPEKFSGLTRLGVIKIDGDSLQANFATSARPASVTSELPSASEQFKMTRVASE